MAATRPDVSILTSGHDVADARLHREAAVLLRAGLTVEVLGLGDPAGAPPGCSVRTWRRGRQVDRALRALTLPWRARGRVLLTLDPDSAVGAWLRRLCLGRRRVRFVADVHEDYTLVLRDRTWVRGAIGEIARAVARVGRAAAARADVTVVADDHLMADVRSRVVLRNLPDLAMLPPPSRPAEQPRAIYVGDLRESRGLFAMIDAIADAPGWLLDLVGPMAADVERRYREHVRGELAERVRWHGRLDPRQAWALAAGAWAGLLLLEDTPAFRAAMPSKLYEYLACGLAVVTTDLPRPAELVRAAGAGEVVRRVEDVALVLRRWAEDPDELARCRERALAASASITTTGESDRFVAAVSSLLR